MHLEWEVRQPLDKKIHQYRNSNIDGYREYQGSPEQDPVGDLLSFEEHAVDGIQGSSQPHLQHRDVLD